jgi:hypothetical protein
MLIGYNITLKFEWIYTVGSRVLGCSVLLGEWFQMLCVHNAGNHAPSNTASHLRRLVSSVSPLQETQISDIILGMTVYGIVLSLVVQLVNRLAEPNQVWLAVERVCLQTSLIPFCIRKLELDLQHPKCQVMIVKFSTK